MRRFLNEVKVWRPRKKLTTKDVEGFGAYLARRKRTNKATHSVQRIQAEKL